MPPTTPTKETMNELELYRDYITPTKEVMNELHHELHHVWWLFGSCVITAVRHICDWIAWVGASFT